MIDDEFEDQDEDLNEEQEEGSEVGKREKLHLVVDKRQEPLRVDKFIMNRLEGATRNKIQQGIDEGYILVNEQPTKANYKIRPGDIIVVYDNRPPDFSEIIPEELPLNIIYEDEDLLVLNKPAGMVVHPGSGNYSGTLVNGLAWYLQQKGELDQLPRVGLVHRIDKDTTGLLLIAKTADAMQQLAAQFKKHTVHRRYVALVWGDMDDDSGTVVAHVGRHERFRKKFAAYPDGEQGKEAITHYKVLERFGYVTLLELQLETGRTHQIRVHMQSIGHPLFGDTTYGGDRIVKGTVFSKYKQFVENTFSIIPRQSLHAKELGFIHPTSGAKMMFTSALPDDLEEALARWRQYTQHTRLNQL
ncbi:MAG: RluA family pseudouridine synthase [Bacteroidetes bacterium]|nr:RluA family pseudouridine synthase [Bacteroidota bacterium]